MNSYYPIMLDLEGKKVVVVGGGRVAERKVNGLLETGAYIFLISPNVTEGLKNLSAEGKINWEQGVFSVESIKNAFMIFAVTNDKKTNHRIKAAAAAHQLVMMADNPRESDFHVPSHFQQGRLNIAISTGGASPILASRIREQLEEQFDETYSEFLEFLFTTRQWILNEVTDAYMKRKLLTAIASEDFLNSQDRAGDLEKLYTQLRAET
jgi:precorrin-2 dehydrogenase/sirohydrochlorin ferrochelatase